MPSIRRACSRALLAILLAGLIVTLETLRPDPAAVQATATRITDPGPEAAPSAPGTYRSASSASSVPITAISIAKPAGTTTDDVLVAMITVRGAPIISAPSGWTLIRSDTSGTVIHQALYRKVAGGSEPASYSFTFDREIAASVGIIAAYSGVDTTTRPATGPRRSRPG
jgi:hypothetical protein